MPQPHPSLALRLDAAVRLGIRPVSLHILHRLTLRFRIAHRRLPALAAAAKGPFFQPLQHAPATAASEDWHGPFAPHRHALDLSLFSAGDIRPVWERNRLGALPLLAQAAAREPTGPHLAQAEALLADWVRQNPPFRGPAWACGQECGLRVLNLSLTLALLGLPPSKAMRELLSQHAQRIEATPHYAKAQDNNHPVSEAAGLLACGLLLGEARRIRRGERALTQAVTRLVSSCGAFAQASARYHRLLVDTLAVIVPIWRHHRGAEADRAIRTRAAAAAAWLSQIMDQRTGRLPRSGPEDLSCFADLAGAGVDDARASVARATTIFGPLTNPQPGWISAGWRGWEAGSLRAILRTGVPLRFRPGHADLLHCDLWSGSVNLLRDGGSGSYNPPRTAPWPEIDLAAARAHNLITFDDAEPMPRVTRFLFARWPRTRLTPHGAETRDARGMVHARSITLTSKQATIDDCIGGGFRTATLRWRLAPATWSIEGDAVESEHARIEIKADAPLRLRLVEGWESPAYGSVSKVPVLEASVTAPARRLSTLVEPRP